MRVKSQYRSYDVDLCPIAHGHDTCQPVFKVYEVYGRLLFEAIENSRLSVCGPTGFVESAAATLVELGFEPLSIRTERFGPSGG